MEKPVPKKRLSLVKGNKEVATEGDEEERRKNEQRKGFETKKDEDSSDESDDERIAVGPRFVRGTNLHGDAHGSMEIRRDRSAEDEVREDTSEERHGSESHYEFETEQNIVEKEAAETVNEEERLLSNEEEEDHQRQREVHHRVEIEDRQNEERERQGDRNLVTREEGKNTSTPVPRRSQREKSAPKWFDSYHMQQISIRPQHDSRLEALSILTSSGILDQIDRNVAYSILDSIIK